MRVLGGLSFFTTGTSGSEVMIETDSFFKSVVFSAEGITAVCSWCVREPLSGEGIGAVNSDVASEALLNGVAMEDSESIMISSFDTRAVSSMFWMMLSMGSAIRSSGLASEIISFSGSSMRSTDSISRPRVWLDEKMIGIESFVDKWVKEGSVSIRGFIKGEEGWAKFKEQEVDLVEDRKEESILTGVAREEGWCWFNKEESESGKDNKDLMPREDGIDKDESDEINKELIPIEESESASNKAIRELSSATGNTIGDEEESGGENRAESSKVEDIRDESSSESDRIGDSCSTK